MKENDYNILKELADALREKFPEAEILAFGSRVRGDASESSDLDVCIVVGRLNEDIDKSIIDIAWETGFKHDLVISTVTYAKNDFENGSVSDSPFVKSIRRSGIAA